MIRRGAERALAALTLAFLWFPIVAEAQPERGPTAWVQLRNGIDNTGRVPGQLSVSWSYHGGQTVRGLAVARGFVVIGTVPNNSETEAAETGKADTAGAVVALDLQSGAKKWERSVPSWVHSDPVIYIDRVVVTFGRLPATTPGGVWCLDLKTGKTLWMYATAAGTMPSATIDVATGQVIVVGNDGILHELSLADGRETRSWGLLSEVSMSSPRIDSLGLAIVGSKSRVTAYDVRRGVLAWRTGIGLGAISDVPVARGGGLVFTTGVEDLGLRAGFQRLPLGDFLRLARESARHHPITASQLWFRQQWLLALDESTGKVVWKQSIGMGMPLTRNQAGAPALSDSLVIVASPISKSIYAFEAKTGRPVWHQPLEAIHRGAPTIIGDDVWIGDASGTMTVYSERTGAVVGHCHSDTPFSVFSPMLVGQTIFVAPRGGALYARSYADARSRLMGSGTPCF